MQKDRGVLLVGGRDMGKTNFLARLWGAAYKYKSGILRANGLPDDLEHLDAILSCIVSGKFADRTNPNEHWQCEIPLISDGDLGFSGKLIVPDCPGEEWEKIYKNNEWSETWENLIDGVHGCLCFVRPNSEEFCAPLDWMTCWRLFGTGDIDLPNTEKTPTQVEIVHWIQCLQQAKQSRKGRHRKLRVGIVVTAWDALPKNIKDDTPLKYLESDLPLLHQFINTNAHAYDFATFGVSIAGGDFKADEDFCRSYQQGDPFTAGYVIHDLGGSREKSGDHTLPVAWAMGIDHVAMSCSKEDK